MAQGGHVFPALAVAKRFIELGHEVAWLGTADKIEARLVPAANIPFHTLNISGLRGKNWRTLLAAPFKLFLALSEARQVMKKAQPDLVLGFGGFASGPGGLAARLLKIPLVIHEQNAIAGLTNKILSRIGYTLQAFPHTFPEAETTGNPVREDILKLPPPAERQEKISSPFRLLIVGGSLGATALNQTVPQALALLPPHSFTVWHQTGKNDAQETEQLYKTVQREACVAPFIDDMAKAYAWADIMICRAGAMTVFEIAATGIASILVPFPAAVDDHQTANAKYLSEAGAAILIPQPNLTPESLAKTLQELTVEKIKQMAHNARTQARPQATTQVVTLCLNYLER